MAKKSNQADLFFTRQAKKYFNFLIKEYGFTLDNIIKELYSLSIYYKSESAAIRISSQPYEGRISVDIYRLVDKKLKEDPSEISNDSVLNCFDFDNLLLIRYPEAIKSLHPDVYSLAKKDVAIGILKEYAALLKKYADDVLRGDFTIFPSLEKVVKERAKK